MGNQSSSESSPDMSASKWLGRNRVSAFFYAFFMWWTTTQALALLAMWWKKKSHTELKRTQNVMAVLAVLLIVATIFAITQEYGDPADFGNEIPTLLFGIFLLVNRFVWKLQQR